MGGLILPYPVTHSDAEPSLHGRQKRWKECLDMHKVSPSSYSPDYDRAEVVASSSV
jgi:hypothetical protein